METTQKKRRGRPPVANKKKQYTLTMRPDLYKKVYGEANRRGISFSAFVTNVLVESLDKTPGVNL